MEDHIYILKNPLCPASKERLNGCLKQLRKKYKPEATDGPATSGNKTGQGTIVASVAGGAIPAGGRF